MTTLLNTDAYKLSMAEAGAPLRRECFHYTHRRGGPQLVPLDIAAWVRGLLPDVGEDSARSDFVEAERHGYGLGGASRAALLRGSELAIHALPAGAWFLDREPVFRIEGPSALVSWLEPLVLHLHYRIQVATLAALHPERIAEALAHPTCEAEAEIARETLDAVGVVAPPMSPKPEAYVAEVRARAAALVAAVEDPARLFEVGLRAASCPEQHLLALEGCRQAGWLATSHVEGARRLGMRAVGTMGHEHVQRHGSDRAAFIAMRERFAGPTSFLLDTFDTLASGLPTALGLIDEAPVPGDSIRYDSGDIEAQYLEACREIERRRLSVRHILEDGFDLERTKHFESLRAETGVSPSNQLYGFGGHIVQPEGSPLGRSKVAAVWKLSQSGDRAVMKFGDSQSGGKQSLPGRPTLWRRIDAAPANVDRPIGIAAQAGEAVPDGYVDLFQVDRLPGTLVEPPGAWLGSSPQQACPRQPAPSPATSELLGGLAR